MTKPLGYKKKVITLFAKVKHLVKYLQKALIEHKTIWDGIILVVAFDSLYNNFEITIKFFFYLGNKDLQEIQLIVTSSEVVNLPKQATKIT